MVIGIRWEGATGGMEAIGLGHRIRELAGWHLIMMESGSLRVTGKEIADGSNMTTAGTGTATGILTGAGTGIATGIATATGTATATSSVPEPPSSARVDGISGTTGELSLFSLGIANTAGFRVLQPGSGWAGLRGRP